MELKYGAEVTDKNGEVLGTVYRLIRDTWTGEIRKFVVRREAPHIDVFLSPDDVLELTEDRVKINVSSEELG